jgi:NAD(P)-dependent dehydrogenase (short-subunit alcohol dehydrogenase family)
VSDDRLAALISGANKGLGFEAARQLAAQGVSVFIGSRDIRAGRRAARNIIAEGGTAHAIALDVTDQSSIAAAVAVINEIGQGLDILINNAGRILEVRATHTTANDMAQVFATNVFGAVELTTQCLPLLTRSTRARIVNVTSTTASLSLTAAGHDFGGNASARMAYSSSKAALNMVTVQLATAFRDDPSLSHVKVNSVTPGYVATDMNNHQGTRTVEEGARIIVDMALIGDDGPSGRFFNDRGAVVW